MNSVDSRGSGTARQRRRQVTVIKDALRDLRGRLIQLNRRIGERASIREVDLDCLDLIGRHGPLAPGALAQVAGLHPATMTGVLDRLERAGWIVRERHPSDRRGVLVRAVAERGRELLSLYAGMNTAVDAICRDYSPAELELLAGFLQRVAEAGRAAGEELT